MKIQEQIFIINMLQHVKIKYLLKLHTNNIQ